MPEEHVLTEVEQLAMERVRRAGVKAPELAILEWIRSVGPATILAATLRDIREVAAAF
jgi:hypothetical protein